MTHTSQPHPSLRIKCAACDAEPGAPCRRTFDGVEYPSGNAFKAGDIIVNGTHYIRNEMIRKAVTK